MRETEAQARLLRALAAALGEVADRVLHEAPEDDDAEPVVVERPPRPADEHRLGKRQRQVVELAGMADEEGLKTAEVAAAIGYEVPNTYTTLQALARTQVVEQVPGREPQRWRLVRRYRAGTRAFARAAALVGPGEWTTAGDVSIAVRGDTRAAEAVARAELSHRLLAGPDGPPAGLDQRARLEAEGVGFDADGRADPAHRVTWDELARRAEAAEERRKRMTGRLNYLEVPARDLDESTTFFEEVFGWSVDRHPAVTDDGAQTSYPEFVDSSGHVGGGFVLGRAAATEPGLVPSIAVESIEETLAAVVAHGGEVVTARTAIVYGKDWTAAFRDPAGNAFALYEGAAATEAG